MSSYYYICPHTAILVSSYYFICTRRLPYMCVLILLYVCPHTAICVPSYCYMCALILLYVCPHTAICVSSYCYMCVLILLYMWSSAQVLMQTEHREPTIIPERQITTLQLGSMVRILFPPFSSFFLAPPPCIIKAIGACKKMSKKWDSTRRTLENPEFASSACFALII
jgi:hypothetical protein